jgi:hypothetical protein
MPCSVKNAIIDFCICFNFIKLTGCIEDLTSNISKTQFNT